LRIGLKAKIMLRKIMLFSVWFLLAALLITVAGAIFLVVRDVAQNPPSNTTSAVPSEPQITPTPYIFSNETIQLAWFYRPPKDGDLNTLVENFDTFVLTKQDDEERDELKRLGVTAPILQYLLFETIHDPGPGDCEESPHRNQVAYYAGDFCKILEENPGWFLLDTASERIYVHNGPELYVRMDPGAPGWRAFWLERSREGIEDLGWDGTFIDNVEASFAKIDDHERGLWKYGEEETYIAEIEEFLQYLYTGYYQPTGRPLYANIISVRDPEVWFRYLRYLDGAMIEAWAVDWDDGFISTSKWEEQMDRAERTQFLGKRVILVSQGDENNLPRQKFALASYLLINHGWASFRYANYRGAYAETWLYDTYEIEIGEPTGLRYRDGEIWRRDFTQGSVMVDPENHTAEITIQE